MRRSRAGTNLLRRAYSAARSRGIERQWLEMHHPVVLVFLRLCQVLIKSRIHEETWLALQCFRQIQMDPLRRGVAGVMSVSVGVDAMGARSG